MTGVPCGDARVFFPAFINLFYIRGLRGQDLSDVQIRQDG